MRKSEKEVKKRIQYYERLRDSCIPNGESFKEYELKIYMCKWFLGM
jgi:hypothetical protein